MLKLANSKYHNKNEKGIKLIILYQFELFWYRVILLFQIDRRYLRVYCFSGRYNTLFNYLN